LLGIFWIGSALVMYYSGFFVAAAFSLSGGFDLWFSEAGWGIRLTGGAIAGFISLALEKPGASALAT